MDVRVGLWRKLSAKDDAFELWCWRRHLRVPWTARRSNQPILKEISPGVHWKDWCWSWNSNTLTTWCEELTHWKGPWRWERSRAGGEGDNGGWNGWMASLTQWTWVWVGSGGWWWTGKPGVLWFMGLQRVRHNWETELNWTEPAHPEKLSSTRGPVEHTDYVKHPQHSNPEIHWWCSVCAWVRFLKREHNGQNTCLFQFPVY